MVLLASANTEPLVSAATLRTLFALTPAEARLCSSLSSGASLSIVAEELDISVHTARVHLKNILRKTGTRRQAELMRLLCLSAPNLQKAR